METSRRWYRLRLSNFLVLNSKYRNQPEANCAALQLIPDQQWLQLFLFGRVKSLFFLGESAHIALPHSTKSFNGYANSPLPSWHKQGSVSNNTDICSFKWNLWEVEEKHPIFFSFNTDANENALAVICHYPHCSLLPAKVLTWMLPNLLWCLEFIVIKSK